MRMGDVITSRGQPGCPVNNYGPCTRDDCVGARCSLVVPPELERQRRLEDQQRDVQRMDDSLLIHELERRGYRVHKINAEFVGAAAWLKEQQAAFSSKQACSRAVTIIRFWFSDYSADQLRSAIANSYIQSGRVSGELACVRRLGVRTFEELQRVMRTTS